jgi:hypothetical protein
MRLITGFHPSNRPESYIQHLYKVAFASTSDL